MAGTVGGGRERVLDAARELFAEHGVSGTSLQMIADRLGVTKAAVYHQFHAKKDIVLALLDPVIASLGTIAADAEAAPEYARRDLVLRGLVDIFIEQRLTFAGLHRDPEIGQAVTGDPEWSALVARVGELVAGPDPTLGLRVSLTMLGGGLSAVVLEPSMAGLADDELRQAMLNAARRLVG